MPKYALALLFSLVLIQASGQTSVGIRGGFASSTYNYLPTPGTRGVEVPGLDGATFALVFEYFNAKNAGIEVNLQYLPMGFKQTLETDTDLLTNETSLNYLKVPVLSSFYIGRSGRFQIKLGPHVGFLINAEDVTREFEDSTPPELPTFGTAEDETGRTMYGLTAGAGISKLFGKSTLAAEARFSFDFTNPDSQDRVFDINSTTLEFTLAYLFQIKEKKKPN
ncbi:porin family protein [Algoriphagus namhaensis]